MMKGFFKRLLPASLFGRSLLILVTPLLLVQVITTYMFFDRHWEKITSRMAYAVAGEIAMLCDLVEQNSSEEHLAQLSGEAHTRLSMTLAYFDGAKLKRISEKKDFDTAMERELFSQITKKIHREMEINAETGEKYVEVNIQLKNGTISFLVPERRLFSSTGYIVLLWMMGTSLILLVIAILFMRNQIRPIRRLAIAAERLGKGRDVPFFKEEGAREVRQAGRAFIEMRARIDRQIAQRTALLAGVSHDLRTPLTRMKLQAAMMPDGRDKNDLQQDIADMEKMVDAYLQFARGEGKEETQRVDVHALLARLGEAAQRDGAGVTLHGDEDITLVARPVAMERAFANLVNNAAKYAQTVRISLMRGEESVTIHIDDDGPGVPVAAREDMFRPFVRGEQSRNNKTGGVGLGLPIAQDIIHSHGGEISLHDSPLGGLRVEVVLPV